MKWVKLAVLGLFLLVAVFAAQKYGLPLLTDPDVLASFMASMGMWGPFLFIVGYAVLIVFTVPGTLVTMAGAAMFPLGWTFLYVMLGAMLGASLSFGVARFLGQDAVMSILGGSGKTASLVAKINSVMESRGLMAVAYLRMAYVPFVVLNYLAPLSGIRFRDFFLGTFLGILPGTFVFVFMGNTLKHAWEAQDPMALVSWRGLLAAGLFALSLALPWLLSKVYTPNRSPNQGENNLGS